MLKIKGSGNSKINVKGTGGTAFKFYTSSAPASAATLVHWVKADAGVTLSSGLVTGWADQSGNGTDWSLDPSIEADQGRPNRVFLVSAAQNGLPSIKGDVQMNTQQLIALGGTRSALRQPAFISGATPAEVFVVLKSNQNVNYSWGGFGSADTNLNHYAYGSQVYETFGLPLRYGASPSIGSAAESWGIYNITAVAGANKYVIRLNGQVVDTTTVYASVGGVATPSDVAWNSDYFYLLAGVFDRSYQWKGEIGEVMIYTGTMTDAERASTYAYLQGRWATPNGF